MQSRLNTSLWLSVILVGSLTLRTNAAPPRPHTVSACIYWGYRELKDHEFDMAERDFESAIARDFKRVDGHIGLGNLYLETGRFIRAREAYQTALQLEPANEDAKKGLVTANDPEKVKNYVDNAKKRFEAHPEKPEYANAWSAVLLGEEKYEEARKIAENVIRIDSKNSHAYGILGRVLFQRGELEDAKKILLNALKHDKTNEHLLGSLGIIALQQNEAKVASRYLSDAVYYAPDHRKWHINLLSSYQALHDEKNIRREEEILKRLSPE